MQTQTVATPKFPIKTNSLHTELKKRVKELSKYVLDKNDTINNVYYYDSNY